MKTRFMLSIVLAGLLALSTGFAGDAKPTLIPWNSPEGIARFERSRHKVDFFALANHFQSQSNSLACGLASSAIVLNTLRLDNDAFEKPRTATIVE